MKKEEIDGLILKSISFYVQIEKKSFLKKEKKDFLTIVDDNGIEVFARDDFVKINFTDKLQLEKIDPKKLFYDVSFRFFQREYRPCEIEFPIKNLLAFCPLV